MKKLAVVLFVSFMAVSAGAANWVESATNSKDGVYSYVDTDSIATQGNYKQSLIKLINLLEGYYAIALASYDCKSNPIRSKSIYFTLYDLEGNVTYSSAIKNSSFTPVLPESIGESQANIVCNL